MRSSGPRSLLTLACVDVGGGEMVSLDAASELDAREGARQSAGARRNIDESLARSAAIVRATEVAVRRVQQSLTQSQAAVDHARTQVKSTRELLDSIHARCSRENSQ
jgi:hypothetical protein